MLGCQGEAPFERIWKRDFVEGTGSLKVGFEVLKKAHSRPRVSLFLVPVDPDVEFSATPPLSCLPAFCHGSCYDENELNL